MFFVDTIETEGLGNRCHLAGGAEHAVAVDPPRDVDRVLAAAAARGVRLTHVLETHLHDDHLTGGPGLARLTGAAYLVPAGAGASCPHVPVHDGDRVHVGAALTLRALATPGHTPHHTAYVLEESGTPVAAFTGGSLPIGPVGRPDLVEPRLTERLARDHYASAHRLAAELPDGTAVLPTHGFGGCSASARPGLAAGTAGPSTVGAEKSAGDAFAKDADTFVADLLAGLDDIPAHYARTAPRDAAGPAPDDLAPPAAVAASLLDAAGREVVLVDDAFDAAAGAGLPVARPACARVSVRQAHARTGPRGGAVLLDVREEDEWRAGHAPGAVHLPLSVLLAADGVPEAVRDREAVVVCRSGQRSQKGARALAERGARAVDVEGGMRAWARAGHPVVDEHGNRGTIA
ncbi:MBL fold metallo-hydrolase [Streptomyces fradiae]|uniref:MBL fold metallo-hydrolase n=1 Tax=Streptomyces fradiae TaxID=1906 RepID=UPI003700E3E5